LYSRVEAINMFLKYTTISSKWGPRSRKGPLEQYTVSIGSSYMVPSLDSMYSYGYAK
jgi:hypothetical protein